MAYILGPLETLLLTYDCPNMADHGAVDSSPVRKNRTNYVGRRPVCLSETRTSDLFSAAGLEDVLFVCPQFSALRCTQSAPYGLCVVSFGPTLVLVRHSQQPHFVFA